MSETQESLPGFDVAPPFNNIPPTEFIRNKYGLLNNVNYVFDESGRVNWRKMVAPEFLVPNKQRTAETDINKLEDKDILILLSGLKKVAQIRGFSSVSFRPIVQSNDYVLTVCSINWLPNFETENRPVQFEALADASRSNTDGIGQLFLAAVAENRALARCIRNFLLILITAEEEVSPTGQPQTEAPSSGPLSVLEELMNSKKVNFEQLKGRLIKDGYENAVELKNIKDIPVPKVLELIERLQNFEKA